MPIRSLRQRRSTRKHAEVATVVQHESIETVHMRSLITPILEP